MMNSHVTMESVFEMNTNVMAFQTVTTNSMKRVVHPKVTVKCEFFQNWCSKIWILITSSYYICCITLANFLHSTFIYSIHYHLSHICCRWKFIELECSESSFQCANNECIEQKERCNGSPDCSDNSDEQNCQSCIDDAFQ